MTVRMVRVLVGLACAALVGVAQAAEMVSVSAPQVMLRSGPGLKHAGTWNVVQGYPLEVLRRQGQWLQVRDFENDRSWVQRSAVGKKPYVIVKARGARLRDRPAAAGRAIGMAQYGEVLPRVGASKGWVQVRTGGNASAWIQTRLVWGM